MPNFSHIFQYPKSLLTKQEKGAILNTDETETWPTATPHALEGAMFFLTCFAIGILGSAISHGLDLGLIGTLIAAACVGIIVLPIQFQLKRIEKMLQK